jgi:conjugal transfer pilus assembly protein TraL
MDKYHVPHALDEPFKVMLWTVDELSMLFIPFLILMFCFNSPIVGLIIGCGLLFILKKLKGEQGHFFLHHLLYWYLPPLFCFKKTPPSYRREWLG